MKIVVVSDTHRKEDNLDRVLEIEKDRNMLIHLGDIEGSEEYIKEQAGCPCYMVAGNNDYFSMLKRDIIIEIGNYNVWLTHGHNYNVSLGYERIMAEGIAQGIDIVMFGHTHKPVIEIEDEITIVNPGSLTYPRQEGKRPSYIVMNVDDDGDISFEIKYL